MQVCRQPVEKLCILGFDGGEVFRRHDIVDGQKAVALERGELILGEGGGGRSGLHRAPSGSCLPGGNAVPVLLFIPVTVTPLISARNPIFRMANNFLSDRYRG